MDKGYHVKNQIIQEDAKVCQMSTFLRQKRLHFTDLYGHIRRREEDNLSRKIMDISEDMSKYELTADMTENRRYSLADPEGGLRELQPPP